MTATTTVPSRDRSRSRSRSRADAAVWAPQVLLALFFAIAGAMPKLVVHPSAVESFGAIGYGSWFMYLIGALELAGALGLVVPRPAGVAAVAFIGLMAGAWTFQVVRSTASTARTRRRRSSSRP
ncbi:DoxX family protein [Actinacidiphila glaucinigra]|uniref:DoxX family protein n=1 Tax=Actinacidiphila glaucinigra TaxID=235986 RepID=UPI0037C79B56